MHVLFFFKGNFLNKPTEMCYLNTQCTHWFYTYPLLLPSKTVYAITGYAQIDVLVSLE